MYIRNIKYLSVIWCNWEHSPVTTLHLCYPPERFLSFLYWSKNQNFSLSIFLTIIFINIVQVRKKGPNFGTYLVLIASFTCMHMCIYNFILTIPCIFSCGAIACYTNRDCVFSPASWIEFFSRESSDVTVHSCHQVGQQIPEFLSWHHRNSKCEFNAVKLTSLELPHVCLPI